MVTDLAESAGYATSVGQRASQAMAHEAAGWLGEMLITRTATRFSRSLLPIIGVGFGAGMSVFNVRRVAQLPLRPPSQVELIRLAHDLAAERPAPSPADRPEIDGPGAAGP